MYRSADTRFATGFQIDPPREYEANVEGSIWAMPSACWPSTLMGLNARGLPPDSLLTRMAISGAHQDGSRLIAIDWLIHELTLPLIDPERALPAELTALTARCAWSLMPWNRPS